MSRNHDDPTGADRENCNEAPIEPSHDRPAAVAGLLVEARGERWRVQDVRRYEQCAALHLAGASLSNAGRLRTLLLPFDRPRPLLPDLCLRRVGRRRWVRELGHLLANLTPPFGLRAAASAGIDLLGWQLEPALAFLDGASRVLLADEVGLGKTIEAGLVIAELRARHDLAHVLIVVPPGLRDQWAAELRERFAIDSVVMDLATQARLRANHLASVNPWSVAPVVIASLDMVKRPEVLPGPAGVIWDLLVVDEAHAASSAPERYVAVSTLARLSRRLLLLTATPHSGDQPAFCALCGVGSSTGEPPILLIRRTRESVGLAGSRRVHLVRVRLSSAERAFHALFAHYTARVLRESAAHGIRGARLAMIVLAKRAFSGAAALALSLERREALLALTTAEPDVQLGLPLDDGDGEFADDDRLNDDTLGCPGLDDREAEREWLRRLAVIARSIVGRDRKVAAIVRLLRRTREPAVVFTEFRDTLDHLADALRPVRPVTVLHGGLDRPGRHEAVRRFIRAESGVLVATDVGGQGLNLHEGCRLVVSVELPWNPMRLEQRIGRVDRLGQRRKVHATHLIAAGTAEEHVLGRLAARLACAKAEVGEAGQPLGPFAEEEVAERMLAATERAGDGSDCAWPALDMEHRSRPAAPGQYDLGSGEKPFIRPDSLASARADAERDRLEWARRTATTRKDGSRGRLSGVPVALVSRRRLARLMAPGAVQAAAALALYAIRIVDSRGALVEEHIAPLGIDIGWSGPATRRARSLFARVDRLLRAGRGALGDAAWRAGRARLDELAPVHLQVAGSQRMRETVIRAALAKDRIRRSGPVQAGLFDHRALHESSRRLAEIDRLLELAAFGPEAATGLSVAGDPELAMIMVLGD